MSDIAKNSFKLRLAYNATLSGEKLLAKIVNGVTQRTVFCPFEHLVRLAKVDHYTYWFV